MIGLNNNQEKAIHLEDKVIQGCPNKCSWESAEDCEQDGIGVNENFSETQCGNEKVEQQGYLGGEFELKLEADEEEWLKEEKRDEY